MTHFGTTIRPRRQANFSALIALLLVMLCAPLASSCREAPGARDLTEGAVAPTVTTIDRAPATATLSATVPAPTATHVQATATAESFHPPDLGYLKAALDASLESFGGLASYYVRDLSSGQVAVRNGDVAISGTSIVKIPILLETYRVLDEAPSVAETRLITETATLSGNYTANLLLERIAGVPDPFAGAQQVTVSMRRLGFYNTFIAVPYDLDPDPRYLATYSTPANQSGEFNTNPDSSMQTTVSDIGRLLTFIYDCSQGTGYLLQVFGDDLTAGECQSILEVMSQNNIDAFIEEGVPAGVPVAHKHGWVGETHGDAAIVQLEDYPYVIVVALHRPGWLEWAESTRIIARLSHLTYEHFADGEAYPADLLSRDPPPLPTLVPTPDLPPATVEDTGGAGLVLRTAPGGDEIMILPEGSLVFLLEDEVQQQDGLDWRRVGLVGGTSGWVVASFLQHQ